MQPLALTKLRGRVLIIGRQAPTSALLEKLSGWGYFCAVADDPAAVLKTAAQLQPEAILLSTGAEYASQALALIRSEQSLRELPVLADLSGGPSEAMRALAVEDFVYSHDELTRRLEAALMAKRLTDRDQLSRRRMEVLLEVAQVATSSLELPEVLRLAVEKICRVVPCDRCSVVLVEGSVPQVARVVASQPVPGFSPFQLDLARYPELRRSLAQRRAVHVEDASRDPLMAEVRTHIARLGVRSVLAQPLVSQDDLLGALLLRLSKSDGAFGREEREFVEAAAAALANSIRNARLHAALKRKREDLESAYVDRYRELAEANQRLKEVNRFKDDLIAVCSHDLRAPLQVLLGHGRLLLEDELTKDQIGSVEAIVRMGNKILTLVESLLERGKGDRLKMGLEPRLLDVAEVCKEAAGDLAILASGKGVRLQAETPESLMAIGDEVKLRQVMQNLVTNALQHSGAAKVVVRVQRLKRPDGEAARVVVQDDGPGLPKEKLRLLFDRYQQPGSGLGLSICREYVELHGGEIWAEGPPEGGTAIYFTLPLARAPELAERPAEDSAAELRIPLVLVVEDEPEVAAATADILRTRFRVELARDGQEGLAKAHALHPDLVVMDVFLPKLDGLDAVVALKSAADTAAIPVILLSAHQAVAEKVRGLNLGALDYLGKPFQSMELLSRVERAIRQRQTELELRRSLSALRRSGTDPGTGLLDRAGLCTRIEQELGRAVRYGHPLALAVLRPASGPSANGRSCAAFVRRLARTPDLVAHLGEGVLAMLLPESTVEGAFLMLSRLKPQLREETGVEFSSAQALVEKGEEPDALLQALLRKAGG